MQGLRKPFSVNFGRVCVSEFSNWFLKRGISHSISVSGTWLRARTGKSYLGPAFEHQVEPGRNPQSTSWARQSGGGNMFVVLRGRGQSRLRPTAGRQAGSRLRGGGKQKEKTHLASKTHQSPLVCNGDHPCKKASKTRLAAKGKGLQGVAGCTTTCPIRRRACHWRKWVGRWQYLGGVGAVAAYSTRFYKHILGGGIAEKWGGGYFGRPVTFWYGTTMTAVPPSPDGAHRTHSALGIRTGSEAQGGGG